MCLSVCHLQKNTKSKMAKSKRKKKVGIVCHHQYVPIAWERNLFLTHTCRLTWHEISCPHSATLSTDTDKQATHGTHRKISTLTSALIAPHWFSHVNRFRAWTHIFKQNLPKTCQKFYINLLNRNLWVYFFGWMYSKNHRECI